MFVTGIDWDNIDDKMLMEARNRVLRLMKPDFGFSEEYAVGQVLKEFPDVDAAMLRAVIYNA